MASVREAAVSGVAQRLESIHQRAGISYRDVAQLMNTTPETVSRWRSGRVDPQPTKLKKLATLAWLVEELSEIYAPGDAKLWLFTPQRRLQGATPAARIEQDRLEDVLAIISQLQDGAFI